MNKAELIAKLRHSRENFLKQIQNLDEETVSSEEVLPGWTIKDIVVHLTLWESELVKLLWQADQGIKPSTMQFSAETDDEINARWHQEHQERPWDLALVDFKGVRVQTIRRLQGFTDKDINDPARFRWSQAMPLWQWVADSSYAHEDEHAAQIQAWRQANNL